ncbi:hypothetical protein H072_8976 [Dactylellina haptotyla CBS 200.50]|uniref:Uncharacterized protein n=1 Tax=Dactylellina haptotyla (strain CBS 200.50) TaxID=1284197 RepID=S8A8D9_DACHA|nr:hypothetical protein H072_8976 [Dactylellina haptotyla CBS 200.50]
MAFQAPTPFTLNDKLKNDVVLGLKQRIEQLQNDIANHLPETEKTRQQIEAVKDIAKTLHAGFLKTLRHMSYAQNDLDDVQNTYILLQEILGLPADLEGIDLTEQNVRVSDSSRSSVLEKRNLRLAEPGEETSQISVSVASGSRTNPETPNPDVVPRKAGSSQIPPEELYGWEGGSDVGAKNPQFPDISKQLAAAARLAQSLPSPNKGSSVFAVDQAVATVTLGMETATLATRPTSVAGVTDRSTSTVRPKAADPTKTFADKGKKPQIAQESASPSDPTTETLTGFPISFNHAGNLPGQKGTTYDAENLCEPDDYVVEKVPILRLQDIPKTVSLESIISSLSGGPLYRISVNDGKDGDSVRNVRITFIHRQHALDLLNFSKENGGIAIKNCPERIQLLDDFKNGENAIGYRTFRKIMTENITRVVYAIGFEVGFWTAEKLRDLVAAAVDRLMLEEPQKYPVRTPFNSRNDIIAAKLGRDAVGVTAMLQIRSLSWGIIVQRALNGLKRPEGFYMERCMGELGPPISPYDDPAIIPTVKAFWVRDPCDAPLENLLRA